MKLQSSFTAPHSFTRAASRSASPTSSDCWPGLLASVPSRALGHGLCLLAFVAGCEPAGEHLDPDLATAEEEGSPSPTKAFGSNLDALPPEADAEPYVVDEQELEPDPERPPRDLAAEVDPVAIAGETSSSYLGVRRVTDYYFSSLYAETSYATPDIPGCSATMIGPNILATAAHCGADAALTLTATGRVYRERDVHQPETVEYDCNLLFHTFPETDLAIYHCPAPAYGRSLGDRFGWVDVSLLEQTQNDYVFSIFSNSINDEGIGAASLLTSGYVSEANVANSWTNPSSPIGSNSSNQIAQAMAYELWSNSGASGSGHFNSSGEMTGGPLSTGSLDALGRVALSMRDYLYYGWIQEPQSVSCNDPNDPNDCNTDNTVNAAYVSSLGLDPDDYLGTYADIDLDYFFDLVQDVEELEGENYKILYRQSFGSRRQADKWTMGPGSTHELTARRVSYATNTSGLASTWVELARHENLNLTENEDYEVSFDLDSTTGYYRVCFVGTTMSCSQYFFDGSADGETTHRVSLTTPAGDPALVLQAWNGVGALHDVTVTTSSTYDLVYTWQGLVPLKHHINDFDTFDARQSWGRPDGYGRPVILPDGDDAGADWAGHLSIVSSGPTGFDYDLETTALPFPEDGDGTLCFETRRDDSQQWQGGIVGRVRVERSDGTSVDGAYFLPTEDWDETCIAVEEPLANGEALRVKFGFYTAGSGTRSGSYLVDDVAVRLPAD